MGASAPPVTRPPPPYRGRFAPSPTGQLHFGSLIAAVASFADARSRGGEWLLRMEDLDRPRERTGAAEQILRTLIAFGLSWDGPVVRQSRRSSAYASALGQLVDLGLVYPCACTRTEIARAGVQGVEGPIYPGTCRAGLPVGRPGRTLRMRAHGPEIRWRDRIQGGQRQRVCTHVGDFVVRRADGLHAYQLAVIVDDAWQGITHVVRGADLLSSTPRQMLLQRALGLPRTEYAHVPLALDREGRKLSKSLDSLPVDPLHPLPALHQAWSFLGQEPIRGPASPRDFWRLALPLWRIERVPALVSTPFE